MSFQYLQYGTGFDVVQPSTDALVFGELVETRGEEVTIVNLRITGYDSYGKPIYSESSEAQRAFLSRDPKNQLIEAGELKLGNLKAIMVQWASVTENLTRLEVDGVRYRVLGIDKTPAYMKLLLTREVAN